MLSKLGRAASVVVGDIEHNLGKSKAGTAREAERRRAPLSGARRREVPPLAEAVYLEAPEERKTLAAYLPAPQRRAPSRGHSCARGASRSFREAAAGFSRGHREDHVAAEAGVSADDAAA